jgi:hypothetical protein
MGVGMPDVCFFLPLAGVDRAERGLLLPVLDRLAGDRLALFGRELPGFGVLEVLEREPGLVATCKSFSCVNRTSVQLIGLFYH